MDGLAAVDYSGYDEGDSIGYLRAYSDRVMGDRDGQLVSRLNHR